ncbi:DNA-binding transcriptional MerR regulator [Roseivirga pacifica]|uniref:DNA-binding transcriptional regulator, MerR family n=1 Tax=Roseivirga pacifica TaxID=1267423 RepID=A0A1I0MJK1_9BACT|nr:MerR family transcriptional regulator [Roseivirga pacifica]RKQ50462.1 DNA-binding transcriptional MerR regulator [Roseivirga pacifica]SEV88577.1 DNA-binding transcriptional regulator, MerR family [Roseivirga pacifica]|tara:strand:+ start:125 stop:1036 length:912 start_codon:yes stop_codon:yes gene_type:complete
MAEASYSIKDLEHLSGIKAHTLRIWEQRYNLINPKRTGTNIRYYDQNDLKLILNVSLLKDHGHKISNIAKMSLEEMHEEVKKLAEKPSGFADQIYALTLSMIDLDEERFEKIISTNSLKLGFERTMLNIIYPFLSKIGIMWMTDSINPAQEHFISNLIRQKVIVAIDGQFHSAQSMDNAKKYMLFLPQGELHELSLLFASYLIQSRKNRVIYLGQNMPFEDLEAAYQVHKPDYLLTVMTSKPNGFSAQDYVSKLSEAFPETEILLSGSQVIGEDLSIPENITQIANPHILVSFIEEQVTVAAK